MAWVIRIESPHPDMGRYVQSWSRPQVPMTFDDEEAASKHIAIYHVVGGVPEEAPKSKLKDWRKHATAKGETASAFEN